MTRIRLTAVSLLLSQALIVGQVQASPTAPYCQLSHRETNSNLDWLVRPYCRGHAGTVSKGSVEWPFGTTAAAPLGLRSDGALEETTGQPAVSGWQQAGIYGLEFTGAAVATSAAAFAAGGMILASSEYNPAIGYAGIPVFAVSSMFLSGCATHIMGVGLGQRRSLGHAIAGGALGGVSGSLMLASAHSSPGRDALKVAAIALPPLCAVAMYNIWK